MIKFEQKQVKYYYYVNNNIDGDNYSKDKNEIYACDIK